MKSLAENIDLNNPSAGRGFQLQIISGNSQGKSYALIKSPMIIGRSPDVEIVLNDNRVSRRHAQIKIEEALVKIEDLKSQNGIFVNKQKVTSKNLNPGDIIIIGDTVLRLISKTESKGKGSEVFGVVSDNPSLSLHVPQDKRLWFGLGVCVFIIGLLFLSRNTYDKSKNKMTLPNKSNSNDLQPFVMGQSPDRVRIHK